MTLPAPTYDLTLLLDPDAEEAAREKIVADARAAIEARGELARYDEWGMRPLTYPIDRKSAAEYYLLQFHAQTPELLTDLQRTLRITDGILRFRLIKLKPGVPAAPDMRASSPASRVEAPPSTAPSESAAVGGIELDAAAQLDGAGEPAGTAEAPATAQDEGLAPDAVRPQEVSAEAADEPTDPSPGEGADSGGSSPESEAPKP